MKGKKEENMEGDYHFTRPAPSHDRAKHFHMHLI